MKVLVSIVLAIVVLWFVLSRMFFKNPQEDDTKRKQLNEWQDRDILEE